MTRSGVNRVSRRLVEAETMPLNWENSVSEGDCINSQCMLATEFMLVEHVQMMAADQIMR